MVESVKAASDVYAPVGGTICAVNDALTDAPETVNQDPYGDGWLFRIDCGEESERNRQLESLMSAREYEGLTSGA